MKEVPFKEEEQNYKKIYIEVRKLIENDHVRIKKIDDATKNSNPVKKEDDGNTNKQEEKK